MEHLTTAMDDVRHSELEEVRVLTTDEDAKKNIPINPCCDYGPIDPAQSNDEFLSACLVQVFC
jgi:hypothetical protein